MRGDNNGHKWANKQSEGATNEHAWTCMRWKEWWACIYTQHQWQWQVQHCEQMRGLVRVGVAAAAYKAFTIWHCPISSPYLPDSFIVLPNLKHEILFVSLDHNCCHCVGCYRILYHSVYNPLLVLFLTDWFWLTYRYLLHCTVIHI